MKKGFFIFLGILFLFVPVAYKAIIYHYGGNDIFIWPMGIGVSGIMFSQVFVSKDEDDD